MYNRPSILIVDDDLASLKALSTALVVDYNVLTAMDGFKAISLLKEHMPDLVILDVMMPDMDGFEVCRIIRSDNAMEDIPIIFLTALDTFEGEFEGLEIGGTDYLAKPVNYALLKLRIRNHIELKERNSLIKEQRYLLARKNDELEAALSRVKQLEGIIPICMYCKKIRDDQQSWQQLETYISEHSEAVFSHGACPECFEKQMKIIANME